MAGHKFNPSRAAHLDGRLRSFLAPAERSLADFAPRAGETWAEIGAGTGYFAIALSSLVGKVYACEVNEEMLALLRERVQASRAENIEVIKSDENSVPLADSVADGVLLALMLHEVDDPARFLVEVARLIRAGGRLCVVEFTQSGFGEKRSHRLTYEQIVGWTAAAGFKPGRTWKWPRRLLGWTYFELAGYEFRKTDGNP